MVALQSCRKMRLLSGRLIGVCSSLAWTQTLGSQPVSGVGLAMQPDIPLHRAETWGRLLVPAKGVDEAEGRDREQVGEEVTMGK